MAAIGTKCLCSETGALAFSRACFRGYQPLTSFNRGRRTVGVQLPRQYVSTKAAGDDKSPAIDTSEIVESLNKTATDLLDKWDKTDEKPAVITIAVTALVGLLVLNGVASSLDKLPLVGSFLKLVGILVTGWFAYRYLVFGPDREELKTNIQDFVDKVAGEK